MTPRQLRRHIKRLDAETPMHKDLEQALEEGVGYGGAWYSSQKEHWLGWLAEYSGPGAYGRMTGKRRGAKFIYNHVQCAPMYFWLAEALGVSDDVLTKAYQAVVSVPERNASQCAALRRTIPWSTIEVLLSKQPLVDPLGWLVDRLTR